LYYYNDDDYDDTNNKNNTFMYTSSNPRITFTKTNITVGYN